MKYTDRIHEILKCKNFGVTFKDDFLVYCPGFSHSVKFSKDLKIKSIEKWLTVG